MEPPLLHAGGLLIRPTCVGDEAGVISCGRDPLISRMPWFGAGFKDEWAKPWIERAQLSWASGDAWVFSILDVQSRYLGNIVLTRAKGDGSVELAYWILPEHRNRGAAKRALHTVLVWAREHVSATRFWAKTAPDNWRSQRVLLASGFEEVARDQASIRFEWRGP